IGRTGAPQCEGLLLAIVIDQHAVTAVEHALGNGVEQLERRDDCACRQHFDLQIAAGHVVDPLAEVEGVFVEDVLRGPRALPAHTDWALRFYDGWRSYRGRRGHRGPAEELAAGRS